MSRSSDGDLAAGVVATLELWRDNVLAARFDSTIDLDWARVAGDVESP